MSNREDIMERYVKNLKERIALKYKLEQLETEINLILLDLARDGGSDER